MNPISDCPDDTALWGISPITFASGAITAIALQKMAHYVHVRWGLGASLLPRWDESWRNWTGRLATVIPPIGKAVEREYDQMTKEFAKKAVERWKKFEPTLTKIPEDGWSDHEITRFINDITTATQGPMRGLHLSGTMYTDGLVSTTKMPPARSKESLGQRLNRIYSFASDKARLYNSLHHKEFAVGDWLNYQVVRMVADMFGGHPNEVMGCVNSGGSESLMVAARSYIEWGIRERGHAPGVGVIIAPASIHASLIKSAQAYKSRVKLLPVDEHGNVNINAMEKMVEEYGHQVVALFGSAPSYPTGQVDPIEEMSKLAHQIGIGMHVDCCLGGWIINNLDAHDTGYLTWQGVTSLSADNHKNGQAPKGVSTLVTKKLGEHNLIYHSIYTIPDWKGGVYGTLKDQGSQSCLPALHAFLSMVAIGKKGYKKIAQDVAGANREMRRLLERFTWGAGDVKPFQILGNANVNVTAFRIDHKLLQLDYGATYAFAEQMSKQGFVLNTIAGDAVHFCITPVTAAREGMVAKFQKAVKWSLNVTILINNENRRLGKTFDGEAKMYCDLEAAAKPQRSQMSMGKWVENKLEGDRVAHMAVKAHFIALQNPYS